MSDRKFLSVARGSRRQYYNGYPNASKKPTEGGWEETQTDQPGNKIRVNQQKD